MVEGVVEREGEEEGLLVAAPAPLDAVGLGAVTLPVGLALPPVGDTLRVVEGEEVALPPVGVGAGGVGVRLCVPPPAVLGDGVGEIEGLGEKDWVGDWVELPPPPPFSIMEGVRVGVWLSVLVGVRVPEAVASKTRVGEWVGELVGTFDREGVKDV